MRWGTSFFVSRAAAVRYYRAYEGKDAEKAVARKLREGEIHLGVPHTKVGERLHIIDGGTRYEIEEPNPSKRSSRKRVGAALKKWLAGQKKNPCSRVARGKGLTLRNMASVTITRLPGGAVSVTGRKLAGR